MFTIYADGQLIYQPGNDSLSLISPKLTVEMGKAGSLEFSIPPTSRFYNNLDQIRTKITAVEDGVEIFRGRVLSNKRSFNNVREVYCEGDLSYLVDSCQQGKKFKGDSHTLFRQIIAAHNKMIVDPVKQFTVDKITVEEHPVELRGQDDEIQDLETKKFNYRQIALNSTVKEWLNTYDYIESTLLDYCGGYLRTRYDAETGKTYIDWLKDYYEVSSQIIQFGKNMLDMSEEITAEDLFTVLIPLGDENLTIKTVNDGSIELADEEAVAKYGRIVQTHVFDGVTSPSTLLANARRYLKAHVEVPTTYEIRAVDLHLINPNIRPIYVGDKVQVLSPVHNIDDSKLVCTKIEYDLTKPENTTYTFGNPKQELTERYRKNWKDEAGRGGGGAGAAADQVSEDQTDFYKAWIDVNSDGGTIDLNTLFKRVYPGTSDEVINTSTKIHLGSNPDGSEIDLISKWNSKLTETTDKINNQAKITTKSGPNGPEVILTVNDYVNNVEGKISLGTKADTYTDENGKVHKTVSTVTTLQTDLIDLTNDYTEIKGKYVKFVGKHTEINSAVLDIIAENLKITANSGYIDVPGIYTEHLFLNNYSILLHTHKLTANGDGKVTIGEMDYTGAEHSFNIADTAFYKNMVSALTIKTVGVTFNRNTTDVAVKITSKSNATLWSADNATYTNKYQPTSIGIKIVANGDHYTLTPRPYGPGSSGLIYKPDGSDWDEISTGNAIYKSVTISSVNIEYQKIQVGGRTTAVSVVATAQASNGNTKSNTAYINI